EGGRAWPAVRERAGGLDAPARFLGRVAPASRGSTGGWLPQTRPSPEPRPAATQVRAFGTIGPGQKPLPRPRVAEQRPVMRAWKPGQANPLVRLDLLVAEQRPVMRAWKLRDFGEVHERIMPVATQRPVLRAWNPLTWCRRVE